MGKEKRYRGVCQDCGKAIASKKAKRCKPCFAKTQHIDHSGKKIGKLTILSRGEKKKGRTTWSAICECGNESWIYSSEIYSGNKKSCGCLNHLGYAPTEGQRRARSLLMRGKGKDFSGHKYEMITVIDKSLDQDSRGNYLWNVVCDCGKEFQLPVSRLNRDKSCGCQRYSNLIGFKSHLLTVVKELKERSNDGGKLWECECECGGTTILPSSVISGGYTKSCGCLYNPSGKDNPRWNHELDDQARLHRRDITGYKKWRDSVFERDNYTCQKCGARGGKINAHHIEPFSSNIELRLDIDNGITLCEEDHKEFHSIYGIKDFSKENYYEYIKLQEAI